MKTTAILMAASVAACASAQGFLDEVLGAPRTLQAQPHDAWMRQAEVTGDLIVHAPGLGDFDIFDIAYGAEVGYRMWITDIFGAGAGIGIEQWDADSGFSRNWDGTVGGDMQAIPLSLTGYLRVLDTEWGMLKGFFGLEYAISNSNLTLTRDGRLESVRVGDSFVIRLGAELEMPMTDALSAGVQIGMQEMLYKGSVRGSFGGRLKDLSLQSAFLGVGLSLAF